MLKKIIIPFIFITVMGMNAMAQGCAEPSSEEGVNLFGYLQTQYNVTYYDDNESTFDFNRARIGAMGNIPYDFSYYFLLETSPFKKDGSKAYLLDAFITYNRYNFAKVSVGSFKAPFGLELSTPCHSLHTINRSKMVNELTAPDRDMGIMLLGGSDTTLFRYAVAVTNGTGILNKDNDTYKEVVGRLLVQPTDWLKFGGSFRAGKSETTIAGADDDERTRFGGELEFKKWNFLVQSEYIYGKDVGSYTVDGGCGGTPEVVQGDIKRSGFFVMALYDTPWKIQPVIKYEYFDADMDRDDNLEQITTYGINYFFNEWTRLQINYEYSAEQTKEINNDRLMIQLQVKF